MEDQLADCVLVEEAFGRIAHAVKLHLCQSGLEALAWLRGHAADRPDVVVLDLNMPVMNGLEVLRAIREDPQLRGQPVVMLSTSESPADIQQAYDLLVGAYWVKGLQFDDLVRQIEALVRFCRHARRPQYASLPALNG